VCGIFQAGGIFAFDPSSEEKRMPLVATKLNTQPARHQVADKIRESILDGSLVPGERLVERKLADTLGTSQSAIREALIHLELEGHVSKKPNSATFVTHFSQRELENTISVRRVLEGFAVEEAARQNTPADIERLESSLPAIPRSGQGPRFSEIYSLRFELAYCLVCVL
jgi:DNA-binding GntR family transcriptional regulator